MYGGGYYPLMDSIDWERAPWNQEEPEYETCPDCNGDGGIYFNEDGDEISKAEYEQLSDKEKELWEFEECCTCNGSGEVIKEADDEPDLDAIYEDRHDK